MNRPQVPAAPPPTNAWVRHTSRPLLAVAEATAAVAEGRRRPGTAELRLDPTVPASAAAAWQGCLVAPAEDRSGRRFGPSTLYLTQALAQAAAWPEPDAAGERAARTAYGLASGGHVSFTGPHAPVDLLI